MDFVDYWRINEFKIGWVEKIGWLDVRIEGWMEMIYKIFFIWIFKRNIDEEINKGKKYRFLKIGVVLGILFRKIIEIGIYFRGKMFYRCLEGLGFL